MIEERVKQAFLKNLEDELAETKKDEFAEEIWIKSANHPRRFILAGDTLFNETFNLLYTKLIRTYARIILVKISQESENALSIEEIDEMLRGLCHYIAMRTLAQIIKSYPTEQIAEAGIKLPKALMQTYEELASAAEEAQNLWIEVILAKAKHALYPTEENQEVILALSALVNETNEKIESLRKQINMLKHR